MNVLCRAALMTRKAVAEQAIGKRRNLGDRNFLAIQSRSFAARSREKLLVNRVVNHAGQNGSLPLKRDRNCEARIFVRKVGGTVQRIDVPTEFGAAFVAGAFLGGNIMLGEESCEPRDDCPLAATVGLRH